MKIGKYDFDFYSWIKKSELVGLDIIDHEMGEKRSMTVL